MLERYLKNGLIPIILADPNGKLWIYVITKQSRNCIIHSFRPTCARLNTLNPCYQYFNSMFLIYRKSRIQSELNEGMILFVLGVLETNNENLYDQAFKMVNQSEFNSKVK